MRRDGNCAWRRICKLHRGRRRASCRHCAIWMFGLRRRMAAPRERSERDRFISRGMYIVVEDHRMNYPPGYRRALAGTQPEYLHPSYKSSLKRAPSQPLVYLPHTLSEITGPVFAPDTVNVKACDLTRQHSGEALGERIIVSGRVMDENSRPVSHTLIEIWQANAAGRYLDSRDQHNAPLDPNFTGCGHTVTDSEGRYRFVTIRPGESPWGNHHNAWRPAHIHFSLFGPAFATRLITQM